MSDKAGKGTEPPEEESFLLSVLPFAGLALLVLLAVVWRYLPEREAPPPEDIGKRIIERWESETEVEIPVSAADFTKGRDDAPVTIVEFSDFECPYCRVASIEVDNVLARFGEDIHFVFKNLPLDTACNANLTEPLHRHACQAAAVARCAGREDEELFWALHDAFYRASSLSEASLVSIPSSLELDGDAIRTCLEREDPLAAIRRDIELAYALGVSGTPTFFVNGKRLLDYRDGIMARLVEHILAQLANDSAAAAEPAR